MTIRATPIRLLCVSHYFESHGGGIEMVAGQLARALVATGMTVTWAASNSSPPPNDLAALVLPCSNIIERACGLPFPLPSSRALGRLLGAVRRADAVLVHDGMYLSTIATIIAARLFRRPVLLVQHIGRVPAPSATLLKVLFHIADQYLTRPMLRLASQIVFISRTTGRHFAKVKSRRQPVVVFNGVDTNVFHSGVGPDERARGREQLGWPAEQPTILFVGRFLEKKGLLRLREMARRRPNLHWVCAGWGPCDPASWGLPNVTVYRGRSGVDLAPLYRGADLLVLPSKSEGFPLVVQEALACGLRPVCCDDAADADPMATPFLTGISNEGSEEEVVVRYLNAIDQLIDSGELLEERLARATFARNRYSWSVSARRYSEMLSGLCSSPPLRERKQEATV